MRESDSTIGRVTLKEDLLDNQLIWKNKPGLEDNQIFKNAFVLNPLHEEIINQNITLEN